MKTWTGPIRKGIIDAIKDRKLIVVRSELIFIWRLIALVVKP
jgi:hypothetical protein